MRGKRRRFLSSITHINIYLHIIKGKKKIHMCIYIYICLRASATGDKQGVSEAEDGCAQGLRRPNLEPVQAFVSACFSHSHHKTHHFFFFCSSRSLLLFHRHRHFRTPQPALIFFTNIFYFRQGSCSSYSLEEGRLTIYNLLPIVSLCKYSNFIEPSLDFFFFCNDG